MLVVVGVGVVVVVMVGDDVVDDDDAERLASKSSDEFEGAGDGKAVYAIISTLLVVGLVSAATVSGAVEAGCTCTPPINIGRPCAARAFTTAPHPSSKVRIRSFSASFSRSLSRSLSARACSSCVDVVAWNRADDGTMGACSTNWCCCCCWAGPPEAVAAEEASCAATLKILFSSSSSATLLSR